MAAGDKKPFLLFGVFSFLGLLIGVAAYSEKGPRFLRFFWRPEFLFAVKILTAAAFGLLILKWLSRKQLPQTLLKWVYGILFLPLVLLPVLRCYFKVPYIFCRSCPTQCPWGIVRTFVFNGFILLNCSGKFWCACLCPFGTFQECQSRVSPKRFKPAAWLAASAYLTLLAVAGMYLLTLFNLPGLEFFETGRYGWVTATVLAAAAILLCAFFIPKFWCRYFCPVGTIAEMTALILSKKKTA